MQMDSRLENVVYDPNGALDAAGLGTTHQHIVLEQGARIHHRKIGDDTTFEAYVEELLE